MADEQSTMDLVLEMYKGMADGIHSDTWVPVKEPEIVHAAAGLIDACDMTPIGVAMATAPAASHLLALLVERDYWREKALRAAGQWPSST